MKMQKLEEIVRSLGVHVLTVLAGLLLMGNPDGATAMMTKLLGWILVASGALKLVIPVTRQRTVSNSEWVWNGLCILAGVLLLARPLLLADMIGSILGVMILVEGIRGLRRGADGKSILTVLAGAILLFLPRTLTRTVLVAAGAALVIIGVINILRQISNARRLDRGDDPNIIDALP